MIVTVANRKGGVGKTTTSVFVAHALAKATGTPCTLVDADPQASAAQWARLAADAGTPLRVAVRRSARPASLAALAASAPNVVIDTPPDDSDAVAAAVELADIVVIPTSPSTLDLSVTESTLGLATRSGTAAAVLLTRTRRTRSVATAEQLLHDAGARVLRTHIALRESLAMAFGRRVRELHGYDLALAELQGELSEQPYSVEAVRARLAGPAPRFHQPASLQFAHSAQVRVIEPRHPATSGFDDDELVRRLKTSVARLVT